MSTNPRTPDAFPITLRHVRYVPWPQNLVGFAVLVVLLIVFVPCCLTGNTELLIVGVPIVILGGLAGWGLIVNYFPWLIRLEKIVLGPGVLHRVPGGTYPVTLLNSITLLSDPHEDYADDEQVVQACMVRIYPRLAVPFALSINNSDVERLQAWAKQHALEVVDLRDRPTGNAAASDVQ